MAWRLDESKKIGSETFAQHYARAREAQADVYADKIGTIGYAVLGAELPPDAARVAIDAFKWTAGKMKPKVYGEKITQEQTGPNGGPLEYHVRFRRPDETNESK